MAQDRRPPTHRSVRRTGGISETPDSSNKTSRPILRGPFLLLGHSLATRGAGRLARRVLDLPLGVARSNPAALAAAAVPTGWRVSPRSSSGSHSVVRGDPGSYVGCGPVGNAPPAAPPSSHGGMLPHQFTHHHAKGSNRPVRLPTAGSRGCRSPPSGVPHTRGSRRWNAEAGIRSTSIRDDSLRTSPASRCP